MTFIGVAGDVRQRGPEREPMPECYMTHGQHAFNGATLSIVARTVGDPNALAKILQRWALERSVDVAMKFTTREAMLSENVSAYLAAVRMLENGKNLANSRYASVRN